MDDAPGTDDLPEWVDKEFSRDLPVLRRKGEGPHLEYMSKFPDQARDLAKEIAAFATSGGGEILMGVADDGRLIGLQGVDSVSGRDDLLKRMQGITSGTVSPPVTPKVGFAQEGGLVAMVISIHKRSLPVYYCENKPYIRHLTESRPAKPEEVVARVLSWAGVRQSDGGIQVDEKSEPYWKPQLDSVLVNLLIALDEAPRLELSPGPEHLHSTMESSADSMGSLINEYLYDEQHTSASLRRLASECNKVAGLLAHVDSGTWQRLEVMCPPMRTMVAELRQSLLGGLLVDDGFLAEAREVLKGAARKARDLLERFEDMLAGFRYDDILPSASEIGLELLRYTYHDLRFLDEEDLRILREASTDLHLLYYHQQFYNGIGSHGQVRERIAEQTAKIEAVAAKVR